MTRRSIPRFLRSRLLPVLAAGLAAVAASLSRADDGAPRTITASAGQVARGAKGYEVGVAASAQASAWVCQGVQVATHIPAPAVGLPGTTVGEDVLPQLPAWRVLSGAFTDANLQSALASASAGSVACKAACDASVAVPTECVDQPNDEYCCVKLAELHRCHAYCDCDSSPTTSIACKLSADAVWAGKILLCRVLGEPLEP